MRGWNWIEHGSGLATRSPFFGVRWVGWTIVTLVGLLALRGFVGRRYRQVQRRLKALEARSISVIHKHKHKHIGSDRLDLGDVNGIRTMTQSEYDALPVKDEKTLYLITDRG